MGTVEEFKVRNETIERFVEWAKKVGGDDARYIEAAIILAHTFQREELSK